MKFLVIGLGSMGKRRIRCLNALGHQSIFGYDIRKDRIEEAKNSFTLKIVSNIPKFLQKNKMDAVIISTPPDMHEKYMKTAIDFNIPFFVEASVVNKNLDTISSSIKEKNLVAVPSSTFCFHPAIKTISKIIKENKLGKISNLLYQCGLFLPDWHTNESVSDYYVSNLETGGAREIVPFELTWILKIFGYPLQVCGYYGKTITIKGAEAIDDTYSFLMVYNNFLANITVDVVSRCSTRNLIINGDKSQLRWSWEKNYLETYNPQEKVWEKIFFDLPKPDSRYNGTISDQIYIDELDNFINSLTHPERQMNTLDEDIKVLNCLYSIEKSFQTQSFIEMY